MEDIKKRINTKLLAATVSMLFMASIFAISGVSVEAQRLQPGIDFSGPHLNLNVHGVPDGVDKLADDSIGSGRHSIFVPLHE